MSVIKKLKRTLGVGSVVLGFIVYTPMAAAELVVSAAASLTNAFNELGTHFTEQHPETSVLNSFAASDVLLQQIINGAPVDVFASADQQAMDKAVAAGVIQPESRHNFVQNSVVLVVPADNPRNIQSLADLDSPAVQRIAYGNPATVPVGRYTQQALEHTDYWEPIVQRQVLGQNVRQVLDYVVRGEVDAAFVFATDAAQAQDQVVVIDSLKTPQPVSYPIALVQRSSVNPAAAAYMDFVLSAEGQAILAKYGFKPAD